MGRFYVRVVARSHALKCPADYFRNYYYMGRFYVRTSTLHKPSHIYRYKSKSMHWDYFACDVKSMIRSRLKSKIFPWLTQGRSHIKIFPWQNHGISYRNVGPWCIYVDQWEGKATYFKKKNTAHYQTTCLISLWSWENYRESGSTLLLPQFLSWMSCPLHVINYWPISL